MVIFFLGLVAVSSSVLGFPYIGPLREGLYEAVRNGCHYNGHLYMEGDQVGTEEPCLNCTCTRGSLVCYLKVCPELPNPPPKHCVLVHRKNHCCPKLICQSHLRSTNEPEENGLLKLVVKEQQGCFVNGTVYAEGSAMASSSLCDYCYCINGKEMCVQPQCLMQMEGCKPFYNSLTCCPTRYDCDKSGSPSTSPIPASLNDCQIDGKLYLEGEMVKEVASSHCENCFCMKGKIHCVSLTCKAPAKNCVPVIISGECCPTKYNCSELAESKTKYTSKSKIQMIRGNKISIEDQNEIELSVNEGRSHRVINKLSSNISEDNAHENYEDIKTTTENMNQYTQTATESTTSEESTTVASTQHTTATETTTLTYTIIPTTAPTSITLTPMTVTTTNAPSTAVTFEKEMDTTVKQEEITSIYIASENSSESNSSNVIQKPYTDNSNDTTEMTVLHREDYENNLNDDEKVNEAMTMEVDTTYMTELPTTLVIPENMFVTDITLHRNVSIIERGNDIVSDGVSTSPVRSIPPEIEALINITRSEEDDYEDYDYDDPSLPPSLPNVKIIPFVAADAVVENEENIKSTLFPLQEKHATTDSPVYNRFSPPIKTEGGFHPRDPVIDGPFYQSKIDVPYITGLNIPAGHMPLDVTVGTVAPPAMTVLPRTDEERCFTDGREYMHGDIVSEQGACLVCVCHHGEIFCQDTDCPELKPGCRRIRTKKNTCCGKIFCDDVEFPTIVLDRMEIPLQNPHLSNILPPVTVADGLVTTPDPFRDVIRTEPAPDLPALIEDLKPYLLEHQMNTPKSTEFPPSSSLSTSSQLVATSQNAENDSSYQDSLNMTSVTALSANNFSTVSTVASTIKENSITLPSDDAQTKIITQSNNNKTSNLDVSDEDDVDNSDSSSLFDSVLNFFFPADSTTSIPETTENAENITNMPINYKENTNIIKMENNNASEGENGISVNNFVISSPLSETAVKVNHSSGTQGDIVTGSVVVMSSNLPATGSYEPIYTSREPPPGRPPNINVSADPGAASGILKLAGCNIYGRMYRVGRIITELSTPCLECMCTEVGVQCRSLGC